MSRLSKLVASATEDAVDRTGGTPLVSEFVDVTKLSELAPALLAARG